MRPIDLAREAGVSTQQVRNYVDWGVLPPAARTESGYRVLGERHRAALLTYRALAKGFGWAAAKTIMHAVHDGDVPAALALVNEAHAAVHEQTRDLAATAEALTAVASAAPTPRSDLRIGEVARVLGVRTSALRVWEAAGLLVPEREHGTGYRRYTPGDIRDARMITMLRQNGYGLDQILPILDGLRESGSSDALLAAVETRRAALVTRTRLMVAATAHLDGYLG
ncbi:MerR family transcriptional regulator [Actinophytocola algeriensis]|uniref:DNA-binding transcriptional MerR regulator n=1 Tax=Actinophytocola algeriensis TaxID=1768010 RepID=A0A7W7QCT8_9PSEU|nr:MerR family transcriptional regulator [Actinophytocola algeriensis]MBB4911212.1 DNA-binding transcriptional MerR regulator [Actinophytocola algeriensis]MBE1479151.1 DNA-binding transcriptional MerR regulator [Actinophytocola algeriensis]